jgi:hypothetical protein
MGQNFLNFIVNRYIFDKNYTISRFYFDGNFKFKGHQYEFANEMMGYGIEDEIRKVKVHGETAIPTGKYKLTLTQSPKFSKSYYSNSEGLLIEADDRKSLAAALEYSTPHELVMINDIPNFSRVLIHWGNTDKDTEGCYLVGSGLGKGSIIRSRSKYEQIYPIMYKAIKSGASCNIIIS